MGKFSFFSFDWLGSKERLELERLRKEKEREQIRKEIQEERDGQITEMFRQQPIQYELSKPFKSCRLVGNTVIVGLHDGTVMSKDGAELLGKVRQAQSEEEIMSLFTIKHMEERAVPLYSKEEIGLIKANISALEHHIDFRTEGDEVFLKGVNLALPPIVCASFIELVEKLREERRELSEWQVSDREEELEEAYEALKMFWSWAALNPIESSRNDLLTFIKKNNITITRNGLLVCYRRAVKVGGVGSALVEFVSNQYHKVKKWKKSPKNYWVWCEDDGSYKLIDHNYSGDGIGKNEGNLEELYLDLPNMQESTYTDAHTHKKDIRIGKIYKEDEKKINLDNNVSCGAGIHVGAESFGFDGFGDVGLIVLVNPMYVRSVPNHECNKMRVSETFIAAEAEVEEYKELIEEGQLVDWSEAYCSQSVEELEEMLKQRSFEKLACQEHVPVLPIVDIEAIKELLKNRIVNV